MIRSLRGIVLGCFMLYLWYMIHPDVIKFFPRRPKDKSNKREVW